MALVIVDLSVSPIGSSPLQLVMLPGVIADFGIFQYPQSDRALCNSFYSFTNSNSPRLSVSPIGSSPLQPVVRAAGGQAPVAFQYPQSDRALCNLSSYPSTVLRYCFQYPQSDRALCNCVL